MGVETWMEAHERYLYHQIHPVKVATDVGAAIAGVSLLWKRRPAAALLGMFVPAGLASWTIMRRADLGNDHAVVVIGYNADGVVICELRRCYPARDVTQLGWWHQSCDVRAKRCW